MPKTAELVAADLRRKIVRGEPARAISGCRRRDRDFYPTLLGESSQDYPAVEPHIMLSKVWNVLAERAEPGAVPVSGG